MSSSGRKGSRSISSVSMLSRQRQEIGEFENKRAKNAGTARPTLSPMVPKRQGPKRRGNYADVKREATRKESIKTAQAHTPYATPAQYYVAANPQGLSAKAAKQRQKNPDDHATWLAEWGVYHSTSSMVPSTDARLGGAPVAFLHSFQNDRQRQDVMTAHGVNPTHYEMHQQETHGNIYEPNIYGNNEGHDMRSNSAWLLGLAHNRRSAVMTTPLDNTNLVRGSAKHGPPEERTTARNLSALGREVLGMVQKDHFHVVPGGDSQGNQVLAPTASASRAVMTDFKTPKGIPQPQLKRTLQSKGMDVSGVD